MGFSKLLRLAAVSATLITQGTLTAQTPGLSHSVAWNNAAVTFIAQTLDVTDTASAAGSLLARWRVGGVDKFVVSKAGAVTAGAASFTTLAASSTVAVGGTPNAQLGLYLGPTIAAVANGDSLRHLDVGTGLTPGAYTGLVVSGINIRARSVAAFTSPADPAQLRIAAITGTGATNAYGIKIDAPVGATTNIGLYNAGTTSLIGDLTVGASTFVVTAATGAVVQSGSLSLGGTAVTGAAGTASIGGVTRTTIGANGGATALTALPLGYLDVYIAGTAAQIPYYNRGA